MKNPNYLLLLLLSLCSLLPLNAQFSISGQITCFNSGDGMTNQEVKLSGPNIANMVVNTDANGHYVFPDLPAGDDYVLTIERDDWPVNGASTFDLVLISQHILAVNSITNPFQLLAIDVNNTGATTTLDMVMIRKLILGLPAQVPFWRFPTSDFNPLTMTGSVDGAMVLDLQADEVFDFVAVAMGDVNGSVECP
jgi:hypothetical protein